MFAFSPVAACVALSPSHAALRRVVPLAISISRSIPVFSFLPFSPFGSFRSVFPARTEQSVDVAAALLSARSSITDFSREKNTGEKSGKHREASEARQLVISIISPVNTIAGRRRAIVRHL